MPSVDVYEKFLKRSQAVVGGRRRWAPPQGLFAPPPHGGTARHGTKQGGTRRFRPPPPIPTPPDPTRNGPLVPL